MNKAKIVLIAIVWLIVLTIGVSIWKFVIQPLRQTAQHQAEEQRQKDVLDKSTGSSIYKYEIQLAADAFSGYAVLRSEEFSMLLGQHAIRLKIDDDQADYRARLEGLASGKYQLAAFPLDALIKASALSNSLPATAISIIDETRGADAIVAYKSKYPQIDSLNSPETKFVLVGDSPSETLARVVMHDFELSQMSGQPFVSVASPEEVSDRYRKSSPLDPQLYVTWEPYVSQMLVNDQMHVLIDSSRFTGYIVDCLVVSRDFLVKNEPVVEEFLECYFRALYTFQNEAAMSKLVQADAKLTGATLTKEQAETLVKKINWKSTQENFAHMGLREGKLLPLENMIDRITNVLIQTDAIKADPTGGQPTRLFYDAPLAKLQTRNFHPGLNSEKLDTQSELATLTDSQWDALVPVGTLKVPELVFARGSAQLTDRSRSILDELSTLLQSWPTYYLIIRGSATNVGNLDANKKLAIARAEMAKDNLISLGIPAARMKVLGGQESNRTRVSFEVGQLPY